MDGSQHLKYLKYSQIKTQKFWHEYDTMRWNFIKVFGQSLIKDYNMEI